MVSHRRSRFPARRRGAPYEHDDDSSAAVPELGDDDSLSDGTVSTHDDDEDDDADEEVSDSTRHEMPDKPQPIGKPKSMSPPSTRSKKKSRSNPKDGSPPQQPPEQHQQRIDSGIALDAMNLAVVIGTDEESVAAAGEARRREYTSNPSSLSDGSVGRETVNGNAGRRQKLGPGPMIVDSNVARRPLPKRDVTADQWRHDLHEAIVQPEHRLPPRPFIPSSHLHPPDAPPDIPTAAQSSPPNRSFSTTVLFGNVPVVIYLPGMAAPIPFVSVPKKQYTKLPNHRPPLRRDKPVRISLPERSPRYIFPHPDRSFIFIPRALRPNQQAAYRNRGRGGGFYHGRRPSTYSTNSNMYTPVIPVSRRPSFGRAVSRQDVQSPSAMMFPRGTVPVVRLPPPVRPGLSGAGGAPPPPSQPPGGPPPMSVVGPSAPRPGSVPPQLPIPADKPPIQMHQPRPQKSVSVADIEPPATTQFSTSEQPFHGQIPAVAGPGPVLPEQSGMHPHSRRPSHVSRMSSSHLSAPTSSTPLSHIPEYAIHAPSFHPGAASAFPPAQHAPAHQSPYFFYPPGPIYCPIPNPDFPSAYPSFTVPHPHPPMPYPVPTQQAFPSGSPPAPPHTGTASPSVVNQTSAPDPSSHGHVASRGPTAASGRTVAHETNGMVYYYDASQMPPAPPPAPSSSGEYPPVPPYGVAAPPGGMMGMVPFPAAPYYYSQPQGMIPTPVTGPGQNGIYYA